MAISPIQIFRNDNSLASILQGGSGTLTGLMDRAIQVGRDISNKQMQQERDFQAANQFQEGLIQRRAEARNLSAKNLFNQQMDTARLGFYAAENVRQEKELQMKADALSAAKLFKTQAAENDRKLAALPFSEGEGLTTAEARFDAAKKTGDPGLVTQAAGYVDRAKSSGVGADGKPEDPLSRQLKEQRVEKYKMDILKQKAAPLLADKEAFTPPSMWMAKKFGVDDNKNIKFDASGKSGATVEQLSKAAAYDKDPLSAEMAFAQQYATADEYANASDYPGRVLSPEKKNLRKKFWEEVMGEQQGGGTPSLGDLIPGLSTP